jgi:uncharacterized protein with NAD-binding domain and iron-sulfur cluster
MKQRIGIIGGGLSGLSTAAHLLLGASEDFAIDVFEAAPFLGGQCASWLDAKGRPTETGIHLDFPWYHNKDALFAAIGRPLPLRETDGNYYVCNGATGKIDTLLAGKSVCKTLWGLVTFPGLTPGERLQLTRFILRILRMDDATAERFDRMALTDFLREEGLSPDICRQLALEAVTIQGLRPEEASAASFIKFLRTMYGSMGRFNTTFFGAPLADALIAPLADFVRGRGATIFLESPIAAVAPLHGAGAELITAAGETRAYDHVVFAIPGYAVPPLLPTDLRTRAPFAGLRQLRETPIITLTLWYDAPVFADGNIYISNRDRTHGPIFDAVADKAHHWRGWAGLRHAGSILQVLIDAADDVQHLTDEQLIAACRADLERFFPICRGQVPADATVLRLTGTYCGTRPGYWSRVPRQHETGLPGVWLAGDYTDGPYHYGMESAVISGKAVANGILAKMNRPGHEILRPRFLPFVAAK